MSIPVRVDPAHRPHAALRGRTIELSHPLASWDCPVCDEPLRTGPITLVLVGRDPGMGRRGWTAASVAVHDDCADQEES